MFFNINRINTDVIRIAPVKTEKRNLLCYDEVKKNQIPSNAKWIDVFEHLPPYDDKNVQYFILCSKSFGKYYIGYFHPMNGWMDQHFGFLQGIDFWLDAAPFSLGVIPGVDKQNDNDSN